MTIQLCVISIIAFLDKIVSVCYFLVILPTKNPNYISVRILCNLIVQVLILVVIFEVRCRLDTCHLVKLTPVRSICPYIDTKSGSICRISRLDRNLVLQALMISRWKCHLRITKRNQKNKKRCRRKINLLKCKRQ